MTSTPYLAEGLKDLEGFSYIFLLYHLHRTAGFSLIVKPFLDKNDHGVFATRVPKRPNSIGLSVLKLLGVGCSTNGYVTQSALVELIPFLDFVNVGLKGSSDAV